MTKDLIDRDLDGFKVVQMIALYRTNESGQKTATVGFFRRMSTAVAFAQYQPDPAFHSVAPALVLTDGKDGYVISDTERVKLFDDDAEKLKIRQAVLARLTPAEREILLE